MEKNQTLLVPNGFLSMHLIAKPPHMKWLMGNLFALVCFRSSQQSCFIKKGVLKNVTNFTGKHLCQSRFFNKAADTGVFL